MPHLRLLTSIAIFGAFVVFVELAYGWSRVLAPWAELSWGLVIVAALLAGLTYVLRTLRLYDYYRPVMRGRFGACLRLTLTHNLLNNLLPMRTGELSFPLLMARYFQVPPLNSVPVLLWFRLMDLHTLGFFALLALGSHALGVGPALALSLMWLATLPLIRRMAPFLIARIEPWEDRRLASLMLRALQALPESPRAFWRAWGWTMGNWAVKLAVFVWVLALFLEAPAPALWLAVIAGDLTSVLPVHGVGGAGTYEAGVMAALLPFGVSAQDALAAAINLHLFLLGSTLVAGALVPWLPATRGET
ncbi:membrane protein [Ectothiorhodospira haloalkaliphila]|uniref:Membrane protein n=1 Tax=Ectothiorhodospira haloalkaliphila TaxID=421628 RepID=W8KM49_9GAMM|nr:lysylphosphatidylglycerol synthase transmembrane domain-containing protein [Ectothiorhodospira haloalkaliphila]AHK80233.1 membrane protein [Ectothiorhodospira haloalkaliphila]